jgi:predicted metal-dependent phosphoesterase TrpH
MIDLHTHSTASDGLHTPSELVRLARARGVEVLALTDHDTVSGVAEAAAEAERVGLEFIPGVELSVDYPPAYEFHMLGYFLDHADPALALALSELREGRDDRNVLILRKLAGLGMTVSMEEVLSHAKGESVGRPAIAQVLVDKGYAATVEQVFDRWLGHGKSAYADRVRLTPEDAIALIRRGKGLAVVAHPQFLRLPGRELEELFRRLAHAGLSGVEVHYFSHSEGETVTYANMASRTGLLPTGGTDYHGPGLHGTELGVGRGGMNVPRSVADDLRAEWQRMRARC